MHDSWTTDGKASRTDGRTPNPVPTEDDGAAIAWYIVQTKPHKEAAVESFLKAIVTDV